MLSSYPWEDASDEGKMAGAYARNAPRALAAITSWCAFFLLLLFAAVPAWAGGIKLAWDAAASPPVVGYKIYFGPAAGNYPSHVDVGNTTAYTVTGLVEGATYHFAATAYDALGRESGFSNDVAATVPYSAPVAQFTGSPTSGVAPQVVAFSNASSGTITSYAWTFGDGGISAAVAPSHTYATPGVYTVSLTVTGPGGSNTQTRSNYITVGVAPPVAQFTGSPTSGSMPLTVNFTSTSSGSITSYAWTFGDGGTSNAQAPGHIYAAAGVYTVSLTVTGPGGSNTKTRNNYVTVGAIPDAGLYRKVVPGVGTPYYRFMLDFNFDHVPDANIPYGNPGDVPLVGYMNPGGKSSLIVYRGGVWNIDTNRNGTADVVVGFGGMPGDIPLAANFTGPGALDDLVIYRDGVWYVDRDLNGLADLTFGFGGVAGDVPLAGDVNGDAMSDLVIYRAGVWYIDTTRNGTADTIVNFGGLPQDVPALFDWNGDGKADLCIFRDGVWYISTKRDGIADVVFDYGVTGDLPFVGHFH